MLVSWSWLSEYVPLHMTPEALAERLMMAGLNHEGSAAVGDDLAVHLEVTSNRPDCLGHLGVAREVAVLFELPLTIPDAEPAAGGPPVAQLAGVRIAAPELCPRYTARVIRGVRVGPSPPWLVRRLATVGISPINNVVDVTNYVLLECGQPLHAFDLARLDGRQIVVRRGAAGESLTAINHKQYPLAESMCVIADARRPVAIAGVMGGAETEVTSHTTELLIESAAFDPLAVRNTARALHLHSDSSYRFERPLDPQGVDWASRRACELILELAGGELAAGMLDVGSRPVERAPIVLRLGQLRRILGIDVPAERARAILAALGTRELRADARQLEVVPPSWRSDLSREIDLVEEVARIHGYEQIPENVSVPMATSQRSDRERTIGRLRGALVGCGFDEAMTLSTVEEAWSEAFSPWTLAPPLTCQMPVLRRADRLRRSLVPSLLGARQINESLANEVIELFEIARVYLPAADPAALPCEPLMLAAVSGAGFLSLKGVVETVLAALNPQARLSAGPTRQPLLDAVRSCELHVACGGGTPESLGYLGEVSAAGRALFELRGPAAVVELRVEVLHRLAVLVPQARAQAVFPAVLRDLNLVVDEPVRWADVEATVRGAAGPLAEQLRFQEVYRDQQKLGPGKKSLLFTLVLRSPAGTLTGEEADSVRERVVAACRAAHGAALRV